MKSDKYQEVLDLPYHISSKLASKTWLVFVSSHFFSLSRSSNYDLIFIIVSELYLSGQVCQDRVVRLLYIICARTGVANIIGCRIKFKSGTTHNSFIVRHGYNIFYTIVVDMSKILMKRTNPDLMPRVVIKIASVFLNDPFDGKFNPMLYNL